MDPSVNRAWRRAIRCAAALGLSAGVLGCGGSPSAGETTHQMQGQVLSVALERKEAVVKHEAIAGFMEAMTMPYYVRDVREIEGLKPGDLITSTLVVEDSGAAYLREVKKVGDAPLERAAAAGGSPGHDLLDVGDSVPDATFVDQDGKPRGFSSFRGQPVVLTFIYTNCPLPTFCPLMDRNFAALQTALAARGAQANARLVTVSFDPTRDTPAVLTRHASRLGADSTRWAFLTGEQAVVDAFAARFGVSVMREGTAAEITHNLRTAVIDANGVITKIYSGNDWTPEAVLGDLAALGSAH